VQAHVDAWLGRLAEGSTVEAQRMSPALFPVFAFSLTSRSHSPAELRDLAITRLQPELARLPGVAQVVIQGGDLLEARVTLDPAALESRGLDAAAVASAIRGATELRSVGCSEAQPRALPRAARCAPRRS
jgi:multidrug efflux pump